MSLLIVMTILGLVFVVPLALLANGPGLGLLVLLPMLSAGVAIATWWTLRLLAFEEEGDPSLWPSRPPIEREVAEPDEAPTPNELDARRTPAAPADEGRKAA